MTCNISHRWTFTRGLPPCHAALPASDRMDRLFPGDVSERPKEHAWKACVVQATAGSNPAVTAETKAPTPLVNTGNSGPLPCVELRPWQHLGSNCRTTCVIESRGDAVEVIVEQVGVGVERHACREGRHRSAQHELGPSSSDAPRRTGCTSARAATDPPQGNRCGPPLTSTGRLGRPHSQVEALLTRECLYLGAESPGLPGPDGP